MGDTQTQQTTDQRSLILRGWFVFGPLFAGLQTFIEVVRLAGDGLNIGQLASWLVSNWTMLTREFWDRILGYFPDIELIAAEKDALTAILFFLPLAISSLHVSISNKNDTTPSSKTNYYIKVVGLLVAIIVLFIVGRQVYNDLSEMLFNVNVDGGWFPVIGAALALLLAVYAMIVILFYLRNLGGLSQIIKWGGSATGATALILTAIPLSASLYLYASQIGTIRSMAIFIVSSSIIVTAVARPQRILLLAQIVIFLIAASFINEIAMEQLRGFQEI